MNELSQLRKEYKKASLNEECVQIEPLNQLRQWLDEAIKSKIAEPNAMVLSTLANEKNVSSRVVLIKDIWNDGIVFFTNYNSAKSRSIMSNPCVSLLFFWPELERQVRIEGLTKKITEKESDNYFSTRPLESRIGAWSSPQSEIIPSRKWLELEVKKTKTKFGNSPPRPKFWGGFIVTPSAFEFWQGRESRLHDRICYQSSASSKTDWTIVRLAP